MSNDLQAAAQEFLVRYGGDTFPNLFTSAKGTIVKDSNGREYLDFTSGQMCATIGHNHPAIVEAVNRAGQKAFHFFSGMIPEVVAELAQTLARDWLPGEIRKTIFINTGSEATEVALRMAKMYTDGYEILALGGSWHGITGGASSVSMASDRKGYGVPSPGVFVIPEPNAYRPYMKGLSEDESALAGLEMALKLFDMQSTGRGAAIIVEPVISAGGRAGAAPLLHAGPAQSRRRPRHVADLRRGADGVRAHRDENRIGIFRRRPGHHDDVEDAGRRPAARGGRNNGED